MKPSEHAEANRELKRGAIRGPYRVENAPYCRGMMDIAVKPGVVEVNIEKGGQEGVSEMLRCLLGYWGDREPDPTGLILPDRNKGRQIMRRDVLPMFRDTPCLRDLLMRPERDAVSESVSLVNGFILDLMWAGSQSSTASNPYRRVIVDEADKTQSWKGDQAHAVDAGRLRITSFGDRALMVNVSTPSVPSGKIHELYQASGVKLHYAVPCPHCGAYQRLIKGQVKWAKLTDVAAWLSAAREALVRDPVAAASYAVGNWRIDLEHPGQMAAHVAWLERVTAALAAAGNDRREQADVLAAHRDRLVWYECSHCRERITHDHKAAMVRAGRWTGPDGFVLDYWGETHVDAETVARWPSETRIGMQISGWYCLWIHWGKLVGEWLRAQGDPALMYAFVTDRDGLPFEFRSGVTSSTVYAAKSARAAADNRPAGVVPWWAWCLLTTIDTQADRFYAVCRAWGGGMRSSMVWHGQLIAFEELDRLIFATEFPQQAAPGGEQFPPMKTALALIDSGGTRDIMLDTSRTHQVYQYAQQRQPYVRAIKGASRPGVGLYWPMRNPYGSAADPELKALGMNLRGWLIDPHRCNDLLSELILRGTDAKSSSHGGYGGTGGEETHAPGPDGPEVWHLNSANDDDYNLHMGNVQKTIDARTRVEAWVPKHTGARHDYRDCEAYQIAAAYMANVHLLPDEWQVLEWKRREAAESVARATARPAPSRVNDRSGGGGDGWTPTPL